MLLGIGIDLVEHDRFAAVLRRHGVRFLARVFSPRELAMVLPAGASDRDLLAVADAGVLSTLAAPAAGAAPVAVARSAIGDGVPDPHSSPTGRWWGRPVAGWAARFAAKEAVFKALGGEPVLVWHAIELPAPDGSAPSVEVGEALLGRLRRRAGGRRLRWHLSWAHARQASTAVAVVEGVE